MVGESSNAHVIAQPDGFVQAWRNSRDTVRAPLYLNHSHDSVHLLGYSDLSTCIRRASPFR